MNDALYWLKMWKQIILGFIVFVAMCVGSCQTTNYQVRKMVESGADPIIASCAIQRRESSSQQCTIALTIGAARIK